MALGDKLKALRRAVSSPITSRLAFGLDHPSIELTPIDTPFQGIALNAFPDSDTVTALQRLKTGLNFKVVALRLAMDLKDGDGDNSMITPESALSMPLDELVGEWLNCAKFKGPSLREIGDYCAKEDISIVFTFNLLPRAFALHNNVAHEHAEALAKLTAAGIAAFFRHGVSLWGTEILNEPSADPSWGVRCVPRVFASVVDYLFVYMRDLNLPYIPKVVAPGIHNVFNDCQGYLREITRQECFTKYKSNLCASYHFYERGYDEDDHERAFWSALKLSEYVETTMLSGTEDENKRYLSSFGGVLPIHVTEIATHLYNYPTGFKGDATTVQTRLEYAVAVAHNMIAAISAGQGPLYIWLLKDYAWFDEKWGILTQDNVINFALKPLSLFLKKFSEGVTPGMNVFSCMHSPKPIADSVRAVAFEAKVKAQPINDSELRDLHRRNSLYYHYHHSEVDCYELIIVIASLSGKESASVRLTVPEGTTRKRISCRPLKIDHSPSGGIRTDPETDEPYAVKVRVISQGSSGKVKFATLSPPFGVESLTERGIPAHPEHESATLNDVQKPNMPNMVHIADSEIVVDMPGLSYVFLYFALA